MESGFTSKGGVRILVVVSDIVTMVESRYYINGRVKYKISGSVRM